MTITNNEYPIAALNDFLKVPEEKIDACLADFKQWLGLARQSAVITSMLESFSGVPGGTALFRNSFIWIDDGTPGIRAIQITDEHDKEVVRIAVTTD
ncbi:hypothetical protein AWB80_08155 [Caballeronia pedi]|uniref:Uncharacterized protein n=1 Tax=Caballeronia pedi TaxID=1777141 RepID=A0A158E6J0_9BURK|nr:hypothetical protein [Caballeronia pedi]SAL01567.1 hypothetical protein AWB80_08155 [Caballeronia pedi]